MSANRARLKWKPRTKRAAPKGEGRVRTIMMNTAEREAMLFEAEAKRRAMIEKGYR